MRLSEEELQKVKDKYNVDTLWSYSRLDTYKISPYVYYLKYVKHEKPLKDSVSPYGVIGGAAHNILEKLYAGEIEYGDMYKEFLNEYDMQIELFGLKFNNTDKELNDSIARKYKADLEHFFQNYEPDTSVTHKMEQFLTVEIQPGIVIQGYLDDIYKDKNGIYVITDYKTSSRSGFTGNKLKDKSAQLILYCKALEQMGIDKSLIRARFCMLRYCEVDIEQKTGNIKTSVVERCQIGEKLQAKALVWLKFYKYNDEEVNEFLTQMLADNSIECLPEQIQKKFVFRDHYIEIENPLSLYDKLKKEIIDIVSDIDNKMHEFDETHDDHVWWDNEDSLKENSYYLSQITEYRIDQILPFNEYCKTLEEEKAAADDLLGVGTSSEQVVETSEDMSWLENLSS